MAGERILNVKPEAFSAWGTTQINLPSGIPKKHLTRFPDATERVKGDRGLLWCRVQGIIWRAPSETYEGRGK